jgi:hypothetical protein
MKLDYDPDEIQRRIEELGQRIDELLYKPVLNSDGDVVSYTD